jgi:hypothetical protein
MLPLVIRAMATAIWLACLVAAACSAAGDPSSPQAGESGAPGNAGSSAVAATSVELTRDVFPIVRERCAIVGCHVSGTTTNHFTDFSTPESTYVRWVNAPGFDFCSEPDGGIFVERTIVVPFAPEQSYLVAKITSTREEPCPQLHSPRMPPPPMPPLASDQVETIVTWIREGALPN